MASTLSLDDIGARKLAINAERQELRGQIRALDEQIAVLEGSRLALVEHDDALSTELDELNEAKVSLLQQQTNAVAQADRHEKPAGVNVQNHSMDANGRDAKPAPPCARAAPEVVPPTAATEQINEADESGATEDGEIDDKSATESIAGDESALERSKELIRKMEEQETKETDVVPPLSQVLRMISKSVEKVTLKRSENAWKPLRLRSDVNGVDPEELRLQVDHEAHLQVSKKPLRQGIIKKAQENFEGANQVKETLKQMEEELEAETDDEKKQEKAANLEALRTKEKRRLQGTIRFIAELYRHFLITDTIIQWCSVHLIKTYEETKDDVYIEYAAHMIERVGPAFEAHKTHRVQAINAPSVNLIEQVMTHFMQIKDTLSNRVRFMILNLDELRKADWKSQRFAREQGPKTIQEVHQDAKEEEIQNRVERDAYERNKLMEQQRGGGGYGQRNKQYGGRPSNDYRQQQPRAPDDRRSQAAAAAMSSGSGLRKDISIKQADNQSEKLGVKSGWAKGHGGGSHSVFFSKQQQKKPVQSTPPVDEKKVAGAVRATIDEYSIDVVTIEEIICKCLQAEQLNEDAIKGFTQYCTEAVEQELSGDCPGLWKNIARIIGWSMFCHSDNVDGPRPHMDIFMPVFKAANEESPKQFSVLVQVLQMMVEEIGNHEGMSEDDIVQPFNTAFDELRKADPAFYDSDDFKDALKKAECKLAAHPNLYSLLKPF